MLPAENIELTWKIISGVIKSIRKFQSSKSFVTDKKLQKVKSKVQSTDQKKYRSKSKKESF